MYCLELQRNSFRFLFLFFLSSGILFSEISWEKTEKTLASFKVEYQDLTPAILEKKQQEIQTLFVKECSPNAIGPKNPRKKELFFAPNLILKKRIKNHEREFAAWIIACFLELEKFIAPTYLVRINGVDYCIQQKLPLIIRNHPFFLPPCWKKMPLEDFWIASLLAYLLGHDDLTAANIGFDLQTFCPVYFDNEDILKNCTQFSLKKNEQKEGLRYTLSFFCASAILRKFFIEQPINQSLVNTIEQFIERISVLSQTAFFKKIAVFANLNRREQEAFLQRVDTIMQLSIREGMTYCDCLMNLFPALPQNFLDYFEEIQSILTWKNLDFGGTGLWLQKFHKYWRINEEKTEKINKLLEELEQEMVLKTESIDAQPTA